MYYQFNDKTGSTICEHECRKELLREARQYYKGNAIDNGDDEFDFEGDIVTCDGDDIIATEHYYSCGKIAKAKSDYEEHNMFYRSGFY